MSQVTSPFKFLDSYQQNDADVFFGREKETQALYNALSGVKHLMVYGPSGAGKTSLIECGLRNQFSDADWFALTIRKGADINASVFASINEALTDKVELDPVTKMPAKPEIEFGQAIEKLFAERYQPVYLLFDQFEELLISGEAEEKKKFFTLLNKLIRNKVPCRIMLIMREEFIGHLSEFEQLCPSIFQHRFRVEKMGRTNVEEVIYHILEAPKYHIYFKVDNSQKLTDSILSKLPDKKKEIELAHVQVFLTELWDRALRNKKNDALPLLSADLVHDDDDLEGVLESFLKKQISELKEVYGENIPLELLAAMISEKFTKLQISREALEKDLEDKKVVSKKPIADLLKELEQRRIIRTIKVGDETQYEISHDVLALVVGQNLTEEMKMREKAKDIYRVYSERQGLFTQDDINYLRRFQRSLVYPPELQVRIDQSNIEIKKESAKKEKQKKQKRNLIRGSVIIIGFFIIAFVIYNFKMNELRQLQLKKQNFLHLGQNAKKQGDHLKELHYTAEALALTKNSSEEIAAANRLLPDYYLRIIFIRETDPYWVSFNKNSTEITIWDDNKKSYTWSIKDSLYIIDSSINSPAPEINYDPILPVYHLFNKWEIDTTTGNFKVLDMENWNNIHELKVPGSIKLIDGGIFSDDKKLILLWGQNTDSLYTANIFDAGTGQQISTALIHSAIFYNAAFNNNNEKIITWSQDSTARLWQKIEKTNSNSADLDYPADLFKLQTQVFTSVEMDPETKELKYLPVNKWINLFEEWSMRSEKHFRNCKYSEYNYWNKIINENRSRQK